MSLRISSSWTERFPMDPTGDETEGGTEEAVKVFVRIRPLNKREIGEKQTIGWDFNETSMLEDTQNGQRVYAYDRCFGPDVTNKETYEIVGKPVVVKAMEGYNGTVFTYGQTGSGKTWTMRGCESDPGMMILCIRDILNFVKEHPNIRYTLKVSYLEVYNEEINDLLGEPGAASSKNLKIVSEDSVRGAVIGGLVEEVAQSPEDFMAILKRGESSRSYASTEMNNESSRSHTIYRVTIESVEIPEDGSPPAGGGKVAYLNLVDLAGSERQKSTKAEGKTLKEGSNINKSLLALGAVINKLGESSKKPVSKGAKPVFIPYRDSKLTRILKQSLGGNTLTSMLCAVTPAPMHREETVSTLKFGQLCKSIKNNVKSNDGAVDEKTLLKQYRTQINDLKAKLEAASKGIVLADPESALGQALQDKSDLEAKVRDLEAAVIAGGGSLTAGGGASQVSTAEVARLAQEAAEQAELVQVLQRQLDEYQDLEEAKAAFEEYQQHSTQELDEGLAKLEEEKQALQNERYKMLKDRSTLDEKESRIGQLITNLDEKESKLRQMMGTIKEQQDQWQRSITDLKRREDLVDDWQTNHAQREKRLQEIDSMQERKFAELNKREADLAAEEQKFKISEKELKEREARLQVALSRVSNAEQTVAALEEKLNNYELTLKKRENDSDIRDRELASRRKEMESWDVLLREKDRKISVEQRNLDEREATVRATEEKVRQRDIESERRLVDLRQAEGSVAEQAETLKKQLAEVEARNVETLREQAESKALKEQLEAQHAEQEHRQKHLDALQVRMSGIEQRERDLNVRVTHHQAVEDEFFNVKVAQITSRHGKELARLEQTIAQQLKIASDYQREMQQMRQDLSQRCAQIEEYQATIEHRNRQIDELREHLAHFEDLASANSYDSGMDSHGEDGALSSGEEDEADGDSHTYHTTHPHNSHHTHNTGGASVAPPYGNHQSNGGGQGNLNVSFRGAPSVSGGQSVAPPSAAYSRRAPAQATAQEFIIQLATTRKMLLSVLEKHDAVPDKNSSWGRRGVRGIPSPTAPQVGSVRGGPHPPALTPQPGGAADHGAGNAFTSAASRGGGPVALGQDGPVDCISPLREGPAIHPLQRQNGLNREALADNASGQPVASAPSLLSRGQSVRDLGNAVATEGNIPQLSPYRQPSSNLAATPTAAAVAAAEEKESSSVRSVSKRHAVLTTPAQHVAGGGTNPAVSGGRGTGATPQSAAAGAKDRTGSATTPSTVGKGSSPYASSYALSPNLSGIVKTGERRNGVPVTTVNLGYSSGLKRGTSFRDVMPPSPGKK